MLNIPKSSFWLFNILWLDVREDMAFGMGS